MTSKLKARIAAKNEANAAAMKLHDLLTPIFAPYLGKKVENADGSLVAKLREKVSEAKKQIDIFRIYQFNSRYSILFITNPTRQFNGSTFYAESSCYIGETNGGILTKLCDRPTLRTDFTADEIQSLRVQTRAAMSVLQDLESKLSGFGEYDN